MSAKFQKFTPSASRLHLVMVVMIIQYFIIMCKAAAVCLVLNNQRVLLLVIRKLGYLNANCRVYVLFTEV